VKGVRNQLKAFGNFGVQTKRQKNLHRMTNRLYRILKYFNTLKYRQEYLVLYFLTFPSE